MGAFCPAQTIDEETMGLVEREVLVPTLDAMRREGIQYVGVLYAGLMLTNTGPRVLEFNCRFGDPECQAILPRLESDVIDLMIRACEGTLEEARVTWKDDACCVVVLASAGYPDAPRSGDVITGVDEASRVDGVSIYHAGTKLDASGRLVTSGGRVLCVSALGATLDQARERAYRACAMIRFEGMVMRSDIGAPAERGQAPSRTKRPPHRTRA
jgi:phosphoribosylamine--glycine ligase